MVFSNEENFRKMKRDTACENCAFKKMGMECPNYIETFWQEEGNPQPVLIKDCAPKRSLLMLQELYNRTFGMQQQINQSENEVGQMRGAITKLFEAIKYMEDQKLLEQDAKEKYIRHMRTMKYAEPDQYKKIEMAEGDR